MAGSLQQRFVLIGHSQPVVLFGNSRTTDSPGAARPAEFLICLVPRPAACALVLCLAALFPVCWGKPKPPHPPGPDPNRTASHLAEVRRAVREIQPVDTTAARALEYSRSYLDKAEKSLESRQVFVADRQIAAADALRHVAEHQEHLRIGAGPKGPPPPQEITDHLQRVYFRIQQADWFLSQSHDAEAASFPKWARDFYELAVRASERHDMTAADENAKCAEEVVKALENLAQAASPRPPLAPPPPPPRPPGPPR